ncbi:MAG: transcriptional regulator [Proteobacteria bacterium]|nr:transcriptional regulator [Pseudomonadota bacterium]
MIRAKEPFIPVERQETIRQQIIKLIECNPLSAREISIAVRIPEMEVYGELDHIRKKAHRSENSLMVTPAQCKKCLFIFKKRDRLKKPGRCPMCHSESISKPLFSL